MEVIDEMKNRREQYRKETGLMSEITRLEAENKNLSNMVKTMGFVLKSDKRYTLLAEMKML